MRPRVGTLLLVLLLAACVSNPPTPSPSPSPNPSPDANLFYLRAWYTQELPPRGTFSWLPVLTIADGTVIDGNVAVPAIYPGPLLILPNARSISDAGLVAVLDEASRLGLLSGPTDFTGDSALPGSRLGHIEMFVDAERHYELTGNPDLDVRCDPSRCHAPPGTPEAFAGFWQEIGILDAWIGPELGPPTRYQPERIALLLTAPQAAEPGLEQPPINWPLDSSMDEAGVEFPGGEGDRCLTVDTDDLATILPFLHAANQLTVFVDDEGNERSAAARVLVPGEDSVCPTD